MSDSECLASSSWQIFGFGEVGDQWGRPGRGGRLSGDPVAVVAAHRPRLPVPARRMGQCMPAGRLTDALAGRPRPWASRRLGCPGAGPVAAPGALGPADRKRAALLDRPVPGQRAAGAGGGERAGAAGRHRVNDALLLVYGPCSSVDCAFTTVDAHRHQTVRGDRPSPPLTASTLRRLLRGTWPAPDDQLIETPYLRPVQPRSASNCCSLMASPSCRYASLAEFMMEAFVTLPGAIGVSLGGRRGASPGESTPRTLLKVRQRLHDIGVAEDRRR